MVTHNHPQGGTFSYRDVMSACLHQVQELRAVTPQNTFSLRGGTRKLNLETWTNVSRAVKRLGLTPENAHEVWKTVARENGLNYVVS